jgi:hypothetical protein
MMIEKLDDSFNCLLALLLPSVLEDGQIDIFFQTAGGKSLPCMHASRCIARAVV